MNRVAVTGMGVVSPLGNNIETFRDALLAGKSGIKEITLFPVCELESKIAGQCTLATVAYKDRKIDFALSAAAQAIQDADLEKETYPADQCGISIGVGLELFHMNDMVLYSQNNFRIPDAAQEEISFLQTPGDLCASLLMNKYGCANPPVVHVSACAAATDAIGHAFLKIRRGQAAMMLAGGTDSMLNPLGLAGFCKLHALSTANGQPEKASRPFDRMRRGFVLGEGSGILILENLEKAKKRGATIHAEITGYGNAFDAYSVSDPHPEGRGASLAIRRALAMSGIGPEEISYINAHGTSTIKNDVMETKAIKKVFGDKAYQIPISSTKSMIGHLISAAGAVEAAASIACAGIGMIHPTVNLDHPDPECDLDYVPKTARKHKVTYFLNNSFAFGGQNSALIFRNLRDDA